MKLVCLSKKINLFFAIIFTLLFFTENMFVRIEKSLLRSLKVALSETQGIFTNWGESFVSTELEQHFHE